MAIPSLSTLATTKYRGAANLTAESGALVGDLNTIIGKVNEIITGIGDYDTLEVGAGVASSEYYGGSGSWFSVDGTNPPTLEKMRMLDIDTGLYVVVTVESGSLVVT